MDPQTSAGTLSVSWLLPPLALTAGWLTWTRLHPAAGEEDDRLERVYACVLTGVLLTGALALLLAEVGQLRPPVLAVVLGVWSAALWRLPRPHVGSRPLDRRTAGGAAALTLLLLATGLPASEDVLGGRDQGIYANTAASIASTGSITTTIPLLADVADLSGGPFPIKGHYLLGFHVTNAPRGEVAPQFLHLQSVFMALGFWLGGLRGAMLVTPLLGALSGLAVFLFVRRLLGSGAAFLAAALLTVNLAQIWGTRNPFSEMLAQLSLFATLWAIVAAHQTNGMRWGVLGALALGAGFLARIDAALVVLALAPALVVLQAGHPGAPRWLTRGLMPLGLALALWSIAHAYVFAPGYLGQLQPRIGLLWAGTAMVLAGCAVALWLRGPAGALMRQMYSRGLLVWAAASVALCALFAFALWIRPHVEPFVHWRDGQLRAYREESLLRIGWYVSTTGLLAAMAGIVVLLRRWLVDRRTEWAPFLLVLLAFALLYLAKPLVHPDHPWMMRRYLPAVLPGIFVAIAAATAALWSIGSRRMVARAAAVGIVATVGLHQVRMALPFWAFREQQGAAAHVADLAADVPAESVLLVDARGGALRLATPLAFFWHRNVLPVAPSRSAEDPWRPALFERAVLRWLTQGREVLYLTADASSVPLAPGLDWTDIREVEFTMRTMNAGYLAPPRQVNVLRERYRLLRALRADPGRPCAPAAASMQALLVGMAEGLYPLESDGREHFRWASPDTRIVFPSCDPTAEGRPAAVRLRAGCWREPAPGICDIGVSVNGHDAGTISLGRDLSAHELRLPREAVAQPGPIEIRLQGSAFVPAEAGLGDDRRTLSFQLGDVSLVAASDAAVPAALDRR